MGTVRVVAEGTIRIGDRVQFAKGMIPTELVCRPGGELLIGASTYFSYGVSIDVTGRVEIGERCLFGFPAVRIRDGDWDGSAPIVIGKDVWLAHGVIVEPGATIGEARGGGRGERGAGHDPAVLALASTGNPAVSVPLERGRERRA